MLGLTDLGLVDEYRLMVFPIVLGGGKRLFDGIDDPATLSLVEVKPLTSGTVILTYHRS
ncbi:MAG: dihydrofolate reductase family protein [Solirubrobacteraceae bacterium]